MGNKMYDPSKTVYCYICNRLFSVSEDGFGTRRMTSLYKLFGRHKDLKEKFQQLRAHSYTTDAKFKGRQSRTQCKKNNYRLLSIWMWSYQFGLHNLYESVLSS